MTVAAANRPAGGAIEARRLVKRYGETITLDGIDLTVAPGDVYGFLGPNGGFHKSSNAGESGGAAVGWMLAAVIYGRIGGFESDSLRGLGRSVLRVGEVVGHPHAIKTAVVLAAGAC